MTTGMYRALWVTRVRWIQEIGIRMWYGLWALVKVMSDIRQWTKHTTSSVSQLDMRLWLIKRKEEWRTAKDTKCADTFERNEADG
jgi:hypothetical protein